MIYYDGVPKHLLNKSQSEKNNKDRLNYAKAKWLTSHGNHLLNMNHSTEAEARRLFKFIDYNNANIISKHQIRLLIVYYRDQFPEVATSNSNANYVVKRLQCILQLQNQNVFDENTFAFFFGQDHPEDRGSLMSTRSRSNLRKAEAKSKKYMNEDLVTVEEE